MYIEWPGSVSELFSSNELVVGGGVRMFMCVCVCVCVCSCISACLHT
jgi:hypothetical protein